MESTVEILAIKDRSELSSELDINEDTLKDIVSINIKNYIFTRQSYSHVLQLEVVTENKLVMDYCHEKIMTYLNNHHIFKMKSAQHENKYSELTDLLESEIINLDSLNALINGKKSSKSTNDLINQIEIRSELSSIKIKHLEILAENDIDKPFNRINGFKVISIYHGIIYWMIIGIICAFIISFFYWNNSLYCVTKNS